MCIVDSRILAENVVSQVLAAGFSNNDVSVLFPNRQGTNDFAHEHHTKAPEGAAAGVGTGGIVGGTLGLLAGIGALAIPGLGPFIAAGPIVAVLSGAAAGATVGGVTGALIGLGVPEMEAKFYEGKIKGGNLLISVHAETSDELKAVEQIFKDAKVQDICSTNEATVPRGKDVQPRL